MRPAITASGSAPKMSCCARSENRPAIHACAVDKATSQAADPSATPSASVTATTVRSRVSQPPSLRGVSILNRPASLSRVTTESDSLRSASPAAACSHSSGWSASALASNS